MIGCLGWGSMSDVFRKTKEHCMGTPHLERRCVCWSYLGAGEWLDEVGLVVGQLV